MKRRAFLKKVGGATGAAALGGYSTSGREKSESASTRPAEAQSTQKATQKAAQTATNAFVRNHKQDCTTGIGAKIGPDFKPTFTLSTRKPGWFPDAEDPMHDQDYLFPEEAIRYVGIKPFGFLLPVIPKPSAAQILGNVLPTEDRAKNPFTILLREIADLVRMYNLTLYELRRFHYLKKFKESLPKNTHGNQPDLPPLSDPDFDKKAQAAETTWTKAARDLDVFIDSGASMRLVAVDMVQVNKYIVSMRVVALQSTPDLHIFEAGGSSSSHVSISSAFSSP
jgi:hypothetical protein